MGSGDYIIERNERILVTGANGFVGAKVIEKLLEYGFRNLRCFIRGNDISHLLKRAIDADGGGGVEIVRGNLRSASDCANAVRDVKLVYHLAASTGEKSLTAAYNNSVETTRRLLEAIVDARSLARIVNVSSFSVYSNLGLATGAKLDESCPIETRPEMRGEAYSFAKIKQEEAIREFGEAHGVRYVMVRPGVVFGPGSDVIAGRVGIIWRGILFHLGGQNVIPFTYVDNCAEAIVLCGIIGGIEGEAINVVDDELLTSTEFLRMYQANVGNIRSLFVPKFVSRSLFWLIGFSSAVLGRATPSKYNLRRWSVYWKGNTYSNEKAKTLLGWTPKVSIEEGMQRYFDYCRAAGGRDA